MKDTLVDCKTWKLSWRESKIKLEYKMARGLVQVRNGCGTICPTPSAQEPRLESGLLERGLCNVAAVRCSVSLRWKSMRKL